MYYLVPSAVLRVDQIEAFKSASEEEFVTFMKDLAAHVKRVKLLSTTVDITQIITDALQVHL